jgi:N-acetylglucosaminyl-diphospho-decaprenol L-rhamnosyltransferase
VVVVIVNYRTAPLTIASLRALAPEIAACPGVTAVVVENASGDDSSARIRSAITEAGWSWVTFIESERNGGYAAGNNLAIRPRLDGAVGPDYFLLLNPDTEVRPGAVTALVDFMEQHPAVGVAGSSLLNPDGAAWATAFRFPSVLGELESGVRLGPVTRLLDRWVVPMKMGEEPRQVDWVPGASMLVRRQVFETVGLMDEEYFLYFEETDFCLQARRAGWSCWYVPASRVMHIAGQSTGVTDREAAPRRRPQYLFDSRRRYFVKNHGLGYAALADLAWSLGFASWRVRRRLQGKPDLDPPCLLADSLRNSVFVKGGTT